MMKSMCMYFPFYVENSCVSSGPTWTQYTKSVPEGTLFAKLFYTSALNLTKTPGKKSLARNPPYGCQI